METPPIDELKVVSFMAGGCSVAVEAEQVRSQQSANNSTAIPTAEQLLGLFAGEMQNHGSRRVLLMKHPAGDYAVTVSEPVELLRLKVDAIHPLPDLIAARSTLIDIRGLAMSAQGVTLLVEFQPARQEIHPAA